MIDKQALLATAKEPRKQEQVDIAQAKIREELASGVRTLFKPAPTRPARSDNVLDQRIAEELALLVRQLGQLGHVLSDYPILLKRHAAQLRSINLMQKKLRHLGRVVAAGDKDLAVEQITLANLKARLVRSPLGSAD